MSLSPLPLRPAPAAPPPLGHARAAAPAVPQPARLLRRGAARLLRAAVVTREALVER